MINFEIKQNKLVYQQVKDYFREGINNGRFNPNEKLPAIKEISEGLGINHLTVRKALVELEKDGLVEIKPRVGTFVSKSIPEPGKKTCDVAFVLPHYFSESSRSPVLGAFMGGSYKWCNSENHSVQTLFFRRGEFINDVGEIIVNKRFDGVLVAGRELKIEDVEYLKERKIPLVQCGYHVTGEEDNYSGKVIMDVETAVQQSVEHLRSLGHKKIAFINYGDGREDLFNRIISKIIFDHKLGDPNELILNVRNPQGHIHWEDVAKFFSIDDRPTGVVISDEFLVNVFEKGCEERDISIPDDISVVGIQDLIPLYRRNPLTVVYGPGDFSRLVEVAFKLLDRLISGKDSTRKYIEASATLKMKSSTALVNNKGS